MNQNAITISQPNQPIEQKEVKTPAKYRKMEKLAACLFEYDNPKDAMLACGYSEKSWDATWSRLQQKEVFRDMIIKQAKIYDLTAIPAILKQENRVVNILRDTKDPDTLISRLSKPGVTQLFKHKKQIAKLLLNDEPQSGNTTINVSGVRNLMLQLHNNRRNEIDGNDQG